MKIITIAICVLSLTTPSFAQPLQVGEEQNTKQRSLSYLKFMGMTTLAATTVLACLYNYLSQSDDYPGEDASQALEQKTRRLLSEFVKQQPEEKMYFRHLLGRYGGGFSSSFRSTSYRAPTSNQAWANNPSNPNNPIYSASHGWQSNQAHNGVEQATRADTIILFSILSALAYLDLL